MAIDVQIPTVGESITEGTLGRWLKKEGDRVQEGESLFELETDKATGEVPSPASGVLHILTKEGETVEVGAVVGRIEADARAPSPKPESAPGRKDRGAQPETAAPKPAPPSKDAASSKKESPPAQKEDLKREKPTRSAEPPPPAPERPEPKAEPVAVAEERLEPRVATDGAARETRKPMSRIRKTIAERLVSAQRSAAILTTFNEADLSQVIAIRTQNKEAFRERYGVNLGFMSFFIKASVEALKAFPTVNASIDGDDIVYHNYYHVGVAVSTERGLMVPVIRDADRLSFAELERAVADYAQKARDGKIAIEDLRGGTFTITNGGVFGSLLSTPLLNPPQSAILGMHAIQKRAVAVGDQIAIRPMMYLALSYDHRLIDGREAVLFLVRIKECIEEPQRLMLGV